MTGIDSAARQSCFLAFWRFYTGYGAWEIEKCEVAWQLQTVLRIPGEERMYIACKICNDVMDDNASWWSWQPRQEQDECSRVDVTQIGVSWEGALQIWCPVLMFNHHTDESLVPDAGAAAVITASLLQMVKLCAIHEHDPDYVKAMVRVRLAASS